MNKNRERDKQIKFRLTEDEKEYLDSVFENSNFQNKSDFFLHLLNNVNIFNVDMKPIRDIKVELSRIGNNVNQIATNLNQGIDFNETHYNKVLDLEKELHEIWHILLSIQSKLP